MDEEEPDETRIISTTLNKKNEAAMTTGHLEIMAMLVKFCKPDPSGSVQFDPVRTKSSKYIVLHLAILILSMLLGWSVMQEGLQACI